MNDEEKLVEVVIDVHIPCPKPLMTCRVEGLQVPTEADEENAPKKDGEGS